MSSCVWVSVALVFAAQYTLFRTIKNYLFIRPGVVDSLSGIMAGALITSYAWQASALGTGGTFWVMVAFMTPTVLFVIIELHVLGSNYTGESGDKRVQREGNRIFRRRR